MYTDYYCRPKEAVNAVYARQSVDKKDSLSIEGQIALCKKYAGEDAAVYRDKGYSGKNIKRPAFTELIRAVEDGTVKKIVVYRLDRFSRSIADFSRLWELLDRNNVEFLSVTENFDTSSPIGRAMLNIVLVFAQLERETTAQRVKDNYIHRFKLGAWPGGPAPFGYSSVKINDGLSKISSLAVSEENAERVKQIFEYYGKGDTSLRCLARKLSEKGIHGPKREKWDSVTLSRILHSPVYVKADKDIYWYYMSKGVKSEQPIEAFDGVHGCNVIGRRDKTKNKYNSLEEQILTVGNHEGIINSDLWLRVQDKLQKNAQISRANAGKYSFLTGLMKCEKCGYALKINCNKNSGALSLVCSGKSNFGVCDCDTNVDLKELESYVEERLTEIFESPSVEKIVSDTWEISEEALAIDIKIERLVNALSQSSEISAAYISEQIENLHRKREDLYKESKKESKIQKIEFNNLTFEEKKIVTREFIEKITVAGENVKIQWKI